MSSDEGVTKLSSELERRYKSIIYKEPFVPLKKNIYLCYDPSWCGTALADNPSGIGNNNEIDKYYDIIRPFEYFKKYYLYIGCKSNMPYQSIYSDIVKIHEFESLPKIGIDNFRICNSKEKICYLIGIFVKVNHSMLILSLLLILIS